MANFLTKIIRKSGICRSKSIFFLKTAKPFFEGTSLLSFSALYSFWQSLHLPKSVEPIFDFEQEHAFVSHFEAKKRKEFVVEFLIQDIHKVLYKNDNF